MLIHHLSQWGSEALGQSELGTWNFESALKSPSQNSCERWGMRVKPSEGSSSNTVHHPCIFTYSILSPPHKSLPPSHPSFFKYSKFFINCIQTYSLLLCSLFSFFLLLSHPWQKPKYSTPPALVWLILCLHTQDPFTIAWFQLLQRVTSNGSSRQFSKVWY